MKRFAMLLACVLLAGCATTGEWTQADTNQAIVDGLLTVGDVLWMIFAH
jgi:uncharacterized lipoprotein YajG